MNRDKNPNMTIQMIKSKQKKNVLYEIGLRMGVIAHFSLMFCVASIVSVALRHIGRQRTNSHATSMRGE